MIREKSSSALQQMWSSSSYLF